MVRNTVVTAKKYTVGNVPPPQKSFPSYSTALLKCHGVKQNAKKMSHW